MSSTHAELDSNPAPIVHGPPEELFRLGPIETHGSVVRGSMPVGEWLTEGSGRINAGSLGVLIDDVLGYSLLHSRPADHWSVSTEITLDIMTPLRRSTSGVHAEANTLHVGTHGAFSTGLVHDDDGRLVAHCTQRGRFIPGPDSELLLDPDMRPARCDVTDLMDLLGCHADTADTGPEVVLDATGMLRNPRGNLHGGIALCASDLAASRALAWTGGPELVTSSVHITYTRPIPAGSTISFRPVVTHRGRSLGAVEVIGSVDGKTCTTARIAAEQAD
jgi:acyl-coenzyme A thioesterase PaaI-like protein